MKKVGFIGLGNMGSRMARNLIAKGYSVMAYDIRKEAVDALVADGAKGASTLKELGEYCDIIYVMVLNFKQVTSCTISEEGVIQYMKPGSTIIVTSTIAPDEIRSVADYAKKYGVSTIDSPVSGGTVGAEGGSLVMMVSCDDETYENCKDVLFAVGSKTKKVGSEIGVGQAVKALNQLLVSVHTAVAGEAVVLGLKAGIDRETIMDIITNGTGNSAIFEMKAPLMFDGDFANRGALDIQIKDLNICLKMGRDLDVPLFLSAASREMYLMAEGMGYGRKDLSAVVVPVAAAAGVKLD